MSAFGLYLHWPFCKKKCPYCDFNSHVREEIDIEKWQHAFKNELSYIASLTGKRKIDSIFFGGGTPSLMPPKVVETLLDHCASLWDLPKKTEITLEANPTSSESGNLQAFRQAGINRLSIGVQSFRDKDLRFLGREHSVDEAQKTIKLAEKFFDRFSFDLIYARPEQKITDWKEELTEALSYAVGHLSLYQLTIEQGTNFYTRHQRGDFQIPDDDLGAAFYETTQELLDKAGLPAYEISNHAKIGEECRHNLLYWQYGDYAGVGPGAHGRLKIGQHQKIATRTHRAPEIWLDKALTHDHGYHPFEDISLDQQIPEIFLMGLRLTQGISWKNLSALLGTDSLADVLPMHKIETLCHEGLLEQTKTHLRATKEGKIRLNGVISFLFS